MVGKPDRNVRARGERTRHVTVDHEELADGRLDGVLHVRAKISRLPHRAAQSGIRLPAEDDGLGTDGDAHRPGPRAAMVELDLHVAEAHRGARAAVRAELGFDEVRVDQDVAKVSVIGVGMRSHAGVAKSMFQALADKGIQLQAISTSEIKVSVLISSDYAELAVRALHAAYGLAEAG